MGRQCHLCHHTCQECTDEGPENCTSCDRDKFGVARYLYQGQCRDTCPEAFYHSAWRRCESCPQDCLVCSASNHCLHCSPGHMLRNGKCVPLQCSEDEVEDAEDEDCLHCDNGCKMCKLKVSDDQTQGTVCLKCEDGYYTVGTDCHRSCPDGTYNVDKTMTCAPCEDKHCLICEPSQCHWCEEGLYISDGECVDHCKEGFFVDKESQECEPCHRSCRACGGPRYDDCDACEDDFSLKGGACVVNKQRAACSERHFRNSEGECDLCHSSCKTCSGAEKEDCSSCHSGHFLTAQQTCESHCPSGTFANKMSNQCEECPKGCSTCRDAERCQHCRSGLYLHDGECVTECPRGFPQGEVCHPCDPECESCEEHSSHCLSCEKSYFLLGHSCKSHCPAGYYAAKTECHLCPLNCEECNQDSLCKKCDQYYFLHDDKCVDDCPDGYYASEQQQECFKCHSDCATCDGPDSDDCIKCHNRYAVRWNGKCLTQCPDKTYKDSTTNECRDCDKSCLSCSGQEASSCLTCDTNRRKDASGHCVWVSECSMHSYADQNGDCQQCHKLCHSCSGPGKDHCLSCNEPNILLNSTCVPKCPEGYYEDKETRVCERCHFSCQTCDGHHSLDCITCKNQFFKQGSHCVEVCSESHFGNTSTRVCDRCDPSCRQCRGRANTDCLSCRENYVYLRQWRQCLHSCPPGYYQESHSRTCHKCHPSCKTCSDEGALACESCYENDRLSSGICNSACVVGFYAVSQASESESDKLLCKPCDQSCVNCHGPGAWNCSGCRALQMLSDDGRCLSCCGNETRHDGKPIPRQCCDCTASLDECILGVNFVMWSAENLVPEGNAASAVTICVLLILLVGGVIFVFLNFQSKSHVIAAQTMPGGYKQLDTNGETAPKPIASSYREYSDPVIDCDADEEEEDEDIVYMGQDGTVYRKFKYGLLDDDEIELEYDDESYSYR